MKTSDILRSFLVASALTGIAARAADPQPAPAAPDIQALMALLNKMAAESAAAPAPSDEPAPTPVPATPAAKAPAPAARQPLSTSLKTGSLSTGGLATSGGLDGHGAGVIVRLTEEAWRLLFPLKQPGN